MQRHTVTICNKLGLHARAAAKIVQVAAGLDCDIRLVRGAKEVNGKSIMGVMMLAAGPGSDIDIVATGNDERKAVEELARLIRNRFGEEE